MALKGSLATLNLSVAYVRWGDIGRVVALILAKQLSAPASPGRIAGWATHHAVLLCEGGGGQGWGGGWGGGKEVKGWGWRGEGWGDIGWVVAFDLSEAVSAPPSPGCITVELLIMPYFYVRGEGGRDGGEGGGKEVKRGRSEGWGDIVGCSIRS